MRRLVLLCSVMMLAAGLSTAEAARPVRMTALVPSWANAAARLGPVAKSEAVLIEAVLPWRDPAGVRRFVHEVSDPSSPGYARYLSSEEFRRRFAPTAATVSAVTSWLRSNGLQVGRMPLNRVLIPARGSAAAIERAFGTTLSRYRVGSLALRAPDRAPVVPAHIARLGVLVRGLDESSSLITTSSPDDDPPPVPETPANPADVAPPSAVVYARPCSPFDGATIDRAPAMYGRRHPAVTCETTVAALRAAYGVDALHKRGFDGRGQTIVMVGSHAIRSLPSDLAEWSRRHGVPALRDGQFRQFSYPGAYETPSDPLQTVLRPAVWAQQAAMLFETMRAIAPGASYRYIGSTSSFDLQNAMLLAVDQHYGDVVVNGWYSASESLVLPSDTAPIDRAAEQAAATGISLLFASGDLGDNSKFNATQTGEIPDSVTGEPSETSIENVPVIPGHPSVSFPAHNSMVTAVGATSLLLGRRGAYVKEMCWGKSHRILQEGRWGQPVTGAYRGSGGGTSLIYDQPAYQKRIVPDDLAYRDDGTFGRTIPDVSVNGDAEAGLSIGYTQTFPNGDVKYSERRVNADTASTALFGAIIVLANQRARSPLGFVNPLLYSMSRSRPGAFRDIVLAGGRKAGVRRQYSNASAPSQGQIVVLKTFEEFGANKPRPGYDTCAGLGSPSRAFPNAFRR